MAVLTDRHRPSGGNMTTLNVNGRNMSVEAANDTDRFRRARLELEGHAPPTRLERSEFQRSLARCPEHRAQLVDDDELRCDERCGCRGPYRVDGSSSRIDGRAR